jgi:hypothetical protein
MAIKLENLNQRLEKLEKNSNQEILTLVEILANATFFGQMKKALCQYAKNGQCSLFVVDSNAENKIPLATGCRIKDCKEKSKHSHIELSNLTCSLCHETEAGLTLTGISEPKKNNQHKEKQTTKDR